MLWSDKSPPAKQKIFFQRAPDISQEMNLSQIYMKILGMPLI